MKKKYSSLIKQNVIHVISLDNIGLCIEVTA